MRSLFSLSLLCFFLADVRDGLGPFFGVYLQSCGWSADSIGYVMTAGSLAGLFVSTFAGALADQTRHKRAYLFLCIVLIVAGCAWLFVRSDFLSAALTMLIQGIAGAAIAPLITNITLGLVSEEKLPMRLGVNEAFNHAGNMMSALIGGLVGYFYGIVGVFFVMTVMGVLSLWALGGINPRDIDYERARGKMHETAVRFSEVLRNPSLLLVSATLFLFHLGNAAMLPLLGQSAVARFDVNPAAYTAATVVLAQATMILMAIWAARLAQKRGYALLFILALVALPIRGCIAGVWDSPWSIVPVQILDGVGAGLLGVATPGIVAWLLKGSGHTNMGLGFVLTIQGLGAALSNSYGGYFAHHISYSGAFFCLGRCCLVWLGAFCRISQEDKFYGKSSSVQIGL